MPNADDLKHVLGENLVMWNCNISNGDYLGKVVNGHSIMGRGFFVVKGSTEEELIQKSDWVLSQFDIE